MEDIGLKVPQQVVKEKCKRYRRNGKPIHRAELLNESDYTILATYQLEYRGIVNYYRMAYNLHTLQKLKWVMEQSLTKTLAANTKYPFAKSTRNTRQSWISTAKSTKDFKLRSRVKERSHWWQHGEAFHSSGISTRP